ncbi:MAG: hypothetical protein RLZZ472_984 [Pseudomonadota bacterium]
MAFHKFLLSIRTLSVPSKCMLQISSTSVDQSFQHPKYPGGSNDALYGGLFVSLLGLLLTAIKIQLACRGQAMILKIKSDSGCSLPRNDACITG